MHNNYHEKSTVEPVHSRFRIEYKFIPMMKGSSVAISILADIEYIDARFKEIKSCYQQLAKKIGEINIVSKSGTYEFDVANSLVSYYRLSVVALNSKRECLLNKDVPLSEADIKHREASRVKWEKWMYHEFREKSL